MTTTDDYIAFSDKVRAAGEAAAARAEAEGLDGAAVRGQAKFAIRLTESRLLIAAAGELPSATEVVAPIIEAMWPLWHLRELGESHQWLAEAQEFDAITQDDVAAANAMLDLQHHVVDLLAVSLGGWIFDGRTQLHSALCAVFGTLLGIEELTMACRSTELDAMKAAPCCGRPTMAAKPSPDLPHGYLYPIATRGNP